MAKVIPLQQFIHTVFFFLFLLLVFASCKKKITVTNPETIENNLISGNSTLSFLRHLKIINSVDLFSVVQTNDGGYIFSGWVNTTGMKDFLLRTDAKGETVWLKFYESKTFGLVIEPTSDNGIVLTHSFKAINSAVSNEAWYPSQLSKNDVNGNELWRKFYTFSSSKNKITSVKETTDGGFILAGMEFENKGFLIKTDSEGNEIWRKSYPDILIYDVDITSNGFVICGQRKEYLNVERDACVVRTDASGNVLWNKIFQDDDPLYSISYGERIKATPTGDIALCGRSFGSGQAGFVKLLNPDGEQLWDLRLNEPAQNLNNVNIPSSISLTHDHNIAVVDSRGYFWKIAPSGIVLWTMIIPDADNLKMIRTTSDNGFIIIGNWGSSYSQIIKRDENGN